jgi:hypothetical protein
VGIVVLAGKPALHVSEAAHVGLSPLLAASIKHKDADTIIPFWQLLRRLADAAGIGEIAEAFGNDCEGAAYKLTAFVAGVLRGKLDKHLAHVLTPQRQFFVR